MALRSAALLSVGLLLLLAHGVFPTKGTFVGMYLCVYESKKCMGMIFICIQVQHLFLSGWLWRTTCPTWAPSPTLALWWKGGCCSELWGDCRKLSQALGKSTHEILFIILLKEKRMVTHFCFLKTLLLQRGALTLCVSFTVKEHPDFGPFLESVNGVAGDDNEHTYWEILSESSGDYTTLNVGEYPPQISPRNT